MADLKWQMTSVTKGLVKGEFIYENKHVSSPLWDRICVPCAIVDDACAQSQLGSKRFKTLPKGLWSV